MGVFPSNSYLNDPVEPDIGFQLYILIGLLTVEVMTYALLRQWVYEQDM